MIFLDIENNSIDSIDLSKYPAGNYLLTVRYEDNSSETKKILKQ